MARFRWQWETGHFPSEGYTNRNNTFRGLSAFAGQAEMLASRERIYKADHDAYW